MSVITRFAPSPTGYFHAGSYRTALFACIFARQNKGKFILRIEDTDRERSKKEYEENILESLEWLGLKYDEMYRQSDRTEIYTKYIKQLLDSGHAYISKEEINAEKGATRSEVIRFKNPGKKVAFNDIIRGRVEFDTTELKDFIIAKSETEPVFHLAVVVDDIESGITHVIRGEDHISNTPRQILIYEALGVTIPQYAHIPLLLAADRSKLSKRNGAIPVTEYRQKGYLPEAVVNYLVLLGWHPQDDTEIMIFDEILEKFSLERVQKGGAMFDEEKLRWFNHRYMLALSDEEFVDHVKAFAPEWLHTVQIKKMLLLLREKISAFGEIENLLGRGGELEFVHQAPDYSPDLLLWKKAPDKTATRTHLLKVAELLQGIKGSGFTPEALKQSLWSYAEEHGKGDVLWPLRVALTGKEKSPDPFIAASLIGPEESLKRIVVAAAKLE